MSEKSKLAYTPTEGIYYVVPLKSGAAIRLEVYAQRADEVDEPAHMMYWDKILDYMAREWKFTPAEKSSLKTAYTSIPGGRVQKKLGDDFKHSGGYVILHGNDVPMSIVKHRVITEFGLGGLSASQIHWEVNEHETMDKEDHELMVEIIKNHRKGKK